MTIVTIHKAKTILSQLIKRAEAGEVIEIARVTRLWPRWQLQSPKPKGRTWDAGPGKGKW